MVEVRQPVVDLVQLDDDAGPALLVAEAALLGAEAAELVDFELAELVVVGRLVVVAGRQLGAGVRIDESVGCRSAQGTRHARPERDTAPRGRSHVDTLYQTE